MTDKEKLLKLAKEAGIDLQPAVYDENGKHVTAILSDGSYSYVDPTFDLPYCSDEKGSSRKDA
ncbi:hypothetical protein [Companilactobacillus jidongensis]|uniref:hypothetical protein n=1 Tax=Companilactobacillus jidongensis TaxID=2486006 RepID=UPI000F78EEA2|nr:hypothetical protein [Companilactobacillus jidongensis]